MAESMGLRVIAEGVENEAQFRFLKTKRCDEIQGYYLSRSLPVSEITAVLGRYQHAAAGERELTEDERTLLIVDNDSGNIATLKKSLRPEGYRILTATTAQKALELLANHEVRVVIADNRLPEMDGNEFFRRAAKLYPNAIRILMSNAYSVNSLISAINEGKVYQFVAKPVSISQLREVLRRALLAGEHRVA